MIDAFLKVLSPFQNPLYPHSFVVPKDFLSFRQRGWYLFLPVIITAIQYQIFSCHAIPTICQHSTLPKATDQRR